MFEETLKSPGQRAKEDLADLSDDQKAGWRLAAILIVCNVLLGSAQAYATRSGGAVIGWIIALVLARNLYRYRSGSDTIVMILVAAGAVIAPVVFFLQDSAAVALFRSVAVWGSAIPLLMVLRGRPGKWRRVGAVVLYAILVGGTTALVLAAALTHQ